MKGRLKKIKLSLRLETGKFVKSEAEQFAGEGGREEVDRDKPYLNTCDLGVRK